jgi:hypothetical protein
VSRLTILDVGTDIICAVVAQRLDQRTGGVERGEAGNTGLDGGAANLEAAVLSLISREGQVIRDALLITCGDAMS